MDNKALIAIAVVAVVAIAGCAAFALTSNSSSNSDKVSITFETGTGYSYTDTAGVELPSKVIVNKDSNYSFKVKIADGYTAGSNFKVKAAGTEISSSTNVTFKVQRDCYITVTGVEAEAGTYFFFICDNYENEDYTQTATYKFEPYTIVPGIWFKSSGDDAKTGFTNAVGQMGYSVTYTSTGAIESVSYSFVNGETITIKDDATYKANLYIWQWNSKTSKWEDKDASGNFLTFNTTTSNYLAVVHGACKVNGDTKTAPAVTLVSGPDSDQNTPNNMKWYYKDQNRAAVEGKKAVQFFFSDNYIYSGFAPTRSDNSNPNTCLVKGLWVTGYADASDMTMIAMGNALDRIGWYYVYKEVCEDGFIGHLNMVGSATADNNMVQLWWDSDENQWGEDTTQFIKNVPAGDHDYWSLTHGEWQDGSVAPPTPNTGAGDFDWAY